MDFRPSVPATGPLRDLHDGLVEQCRRHIEDLRAHAAELENAIDMIANVLVEWLKEKFESGEEEELEAMLEEWGAGVWLLMG